MLRHVLTFVLFFSGFGDAQLPAPPAFRAVEGAFFAISVQDLDASTNWYSEKFGLKVQSSFSDGGVAGAVLSGNGLDVELMAFAKSSPQRDPFDTKDLPHPRGIIKVGFRVDDFDAAVSVLRSRGVQIVLGPYPPRKDQRANVLLRDNSGNLIQVFGRFAP